MFAFLIVLGAFLQGWCLDNVVIRGRVIDSTASQPVSGLQVSANFFLKTPKTTATNASGMYEIGFAGSEVTAGGAITLKTDLALGNLQYSSQIVSVPAGANQNDGINDTVNVADIVVKSSVKFDSISIKGKVIDSVSNNPVPNVSVNILYMKVGSYVLTTISLKTGSDGTFSWDSVNCFSIKKVSFSVPTVAGFIKGFAADDSLPSNANISDGTKDVISHTIMVKLLSGVRPVLASNFSTTKAFGPVSVSFYGIDGRLLLHTMISDIAKFDAGQAKSLFRSARPVIMVWRQGNQTISKKLFVTK